MIPFELGLSHGSQGLHELIWGNAMYFSFYDHDVWICVTNSRSHNEVALLVFKSYSELLLSLEGLLE